MAKVFNSMRNPAYDDIKTLCQSFPENPFYTHEYSGARQGNGFLPLLLTLRNHGVLISGCLAFLKAGRFNRLLEIYSTPTAINDRSFWEGLVAMCRREKVSILTLNSYAISRTLRLPEIPGLIRKATRWEHFLNLTRTDLWDRLKSNHRRNIRKARKAGVRIAVAATEDDCRKHITLLDASMRRRVERGEKIERYDIYRFIANIIEQRAGCFYQAVKGKEVLSSILVLNSKEAAYYHSGGTLPEGMKCGSSHFLMHEASLILQAESKKKFFLGGAQQHETGLARYKNGFGCEHVSGESATYFVGNMLQKLIHAIARHMV